jgi:hypothetical protein
VVPLRRFTHQSPLVLKAPFLIPDPPPTGPADFTLTLGETSASRLPSATVSTKITMTPINGFLASVRLTASGLPAGVTARFAPTQIYPNSSVAAVDLVIAATTRAGVYPITIGTDSPLGRTATFTLTVRADFTISLSLDSGTVTSGAAATVPTNVSMSSSNGSAPPAELSFKYVPTGVTVTSNRRTVGLGSPTAVTFRAAPGAAPGLYNIVVGAEGSRNSCTYGLYVQEGLPVE